MNTKIISKINNQGGRCLAVGGFVRDSLMGISPKDIDIEVHNMDTETLISILSEFGKVNKVGVSFGVIKLWTAEGDFDFSLPRRENKVGQGHKGFQVEVDTSLTIEEAASRRDFTINSMACDLIGGNIIDPFGGEVDLENKVLRHTSPAFSEDPLRVLRGMQFAGRFEMIVANDTAKLCESLKNEFSSLPKERVWEEWKKWAEKSVKPSFGLKFLNQTSWVTLFPELNNLNGCPQDSIWHPEGDVFEHTCHVVDAMAEICRRDNITGEDRVVRMFGALCHDFGKPSTTVQNKIGRWISPKHAQVGEEFTRSFLMSVGMPVSLIDKVVETVIEHMVHVDFNGSTKTVRRFLVRLKAASINDVMAVIEADHSGRPPLPKGMPESAKQMLVISEELGSKVEPILMGRHLIPLGVKPGPEMGALLKEAFEAQLEEQFSDLDEALNWIKFKVNCIDIQDKIC